jgi:hypothetical protein
MTFFRGDQEREYSGRNLENAVLEFNSALSHFGHGVGFKTFKCVQGIATILGPVLLVLC